MDHIEMILSKTIYILVEGLNDKKSVKECSPHFLLLFFNDRVLFSSKTQWIAAFPRISDLQ